MTDNFEPPVRLAVIGAGRIGRQHVSAVRRSSKMDLVAIADPSDEAQAAISLDGVARVGSVDELLAEVPIDAAIVAVPSAYHVAVVSPLIDAGIPVLCEKPAGLRRVDVRELGALSASRGIPLQVGYWRRFLPSLRELRERIVAGAYGELAMMIAIQWDGEPPPPAFRDPSSSGGILIDMGVHEFDMLRWLTGQEIEEVAGFASDVTWAPPVEGDAETVNIVARLSGGTTAVVSLARRHPPGDLCRIEALGGEGHVALAYLQPREADAQLLDALQAQAEALAASVRGASPQGADIADAEAAVAAAEQGAATLVAERFPHDVTASPEVRQ